MKTNNLSMVFKMILLAIAAIITAVIVTVVMRTANEGKAMVNAGTTQVKDMTAKYADIDKASYDNTNIIGSALTDLIGDTIADKTYLSIWIKTKSNSTTGVYYNYTLTQAAGGNTIAVGTALTAVVTDKASNNYINPNAQFTGKTFTDANKNIICIEFDQMN